MVVVLLLSALVVVVVVGAGLYLPFVEDQLAQAARSVQGCWLAAALRSAALELACCLRRCPCRC